MTCLIISSYIASFIIHQLLHQNSIS